MHESSYDKMAEFRGRYLDSKRETPLLILDIGSMDVNGSYRPLFDVSEWRYRGADMAPGKNVDIVLNNPYQWREIPSASIDVLISGQAFEHIEYFWFTILEIERILKPGGLCCLIAPSGGYEHKYPVDCWRFYSDGFAALAKFGRLSVLEVTTQWEEREKYVNDDSNKWKDTMLVARKEIPNRFIAFKRAIRRSIFWYIVKYVA